MIRTLLFSTLYPSSVRPGHGIFVETRLRQLLSSGKVETKVVAPVPWFPFQHKAFGEYALHASVPKKENRNGIEIIHPRYLLLPKIGMNSAPASLARSGLLAAQRLISEGFDFDLIDAHYFYPDGVAATLIGKALGKPVVITARGTDINLIPQFQKPREMILEAARDADVVITVSGALKQSLMEIGADGKKITVLRNGVDLELFRPVDRTLARSKMAVGGYVIASVGNLIPEKGHDLVIRALPELSDATLLIAGKGPYQRELEALAMSLNVADRVRFLGSVSQTILCTLYSAADCLVLASVREGWPNVLLEAMACGTPAIASNVGGVPEIISKAEAGRILGARTEQAVLASIRELRANPPCRKVTRAYAEQFGWQSITDSQVRLFKALK
jgi:glycosyltransferase involved in cell wall biosynthesis